jgi:peptidoglycan/xylan/chitin deacetylase (PgdA/CDA1 family)
METPVRETLRPLCWAEIRRLSAAGFEIGAHTVEHAILGRETREVRRREIAGSVAELAAELGRTPAGFAYPNGGPGDYGTEDAALLEQLGVAYAVTTRPDFVRDQSPYDLPRVALGGGHDPAGFALELSGLLDGRRRRQQGWS